GVHRGRRKQVRPRPTRRARALAGRARRPPQRRRPSAGRHPLIADRSFLDPDLVADPHPYLHRLRAEDPVHWSEHHQAWLLTRYDGVAGAFLDRRFAWERVGSLPPAAPTRKEREAFDPVYGMLGNWMVFGAPPAHSRLRRLARAAFTGRTVERMRPAIES